MFSNPNNISQITCDTNQTCNIVKNKHIESTIQDHFLVIESNDRNSNLYPNISDYVVELPKQYRKVKKIDLTFAYIPNSLFNINNNNNKLYFSEQDNYDIPLEIHIPKGQYDKTLSQTTSIISNTQIYQDQLGKIIQDYLNNVGNATYSVEFDKLSNNYIIESDLYDTINQEPTLFSLLFKGNDIPIGKYSTEKVPVRNMDNTIKRDSKNNVIYEDKFFGEKMSTYKKNSIGKHIGFNKLNYNGLITTQIENINNKPHNVLGTNTTFTKDLVKNKYIVIANQLPNQPIQYYRYKIINILNDYEIELDSPVVQINNASLYKGWFQGEFIRNLDTDKYVILQLLNGDYGRLDSHNSNIQDSFAILPILNNNKQPWPDEKKFYIEYKKQLPDIDKLHIRFVNNNGDLIEFNGMDHLLIFCITTQLN